MHKLKQLTACLLAVMLAFSATATMVLAAGDPTIRVSEADANQGETVDVTVSLENNPGIINLKLKVAYDGAALTLTNVVDAGIFETSYNAPVNQENPAGNPYILSWANDTATENLTVNGTLVTLTFAVDENAAFGKYDITVTYGNGYIYDKDMQPVDFAVVNGAVTVKDLQEIIYNSNTGTGTMENTMGIEGASVTLSENNFTRDGYTFTGWNTAADGTGTGYADKASITMPTGGLTLYAQWVIYGDIDGNGDVTDKDRTILARYLAGWAGYEISVRAADVNADGKVTDIDRTILARHLAGWSGYATLPYIK